MKKPSSHYQTWEGDEGGWAPSCAGPGCGRALRSGDRYLVPRDSLVVLCQPCAEAPKEEPAPDPEPAPPAPPKPKKEPRPKAARPPRQPKRAMNIGSRTPKASCPICGASFPARGHGGGKRQVYCSLACSYESRKGPRSLTPCERCGTPFPTRSHGPMHRQRYCSPACAVGGHKRREATCPVCGSAFLARWNRVTERYQRYCSIRCSAVKKRAPSMPCPICGTPFPMRSHGKQGPQRYCSPTCVHASQRAERRSA